MLKDFYFSVSTSICLDVPNGVDDDDFFFEHIGNNKTDIEERLQVACRENAIELFDVEDLEEENS